MATKERLLELLNANKGDYLSGEEIAQQLAVSRTAVWKAVKALRADGYEIDAVQNRGYSLAVCTDVLTADGVARHLNTLGAFLNVEVIPLVPSTNAMLRDKANAGAGEGCVILANAQTQGRGRMGRSFYSPPDTGIYLSLLLRPLGITPERAVRITTMAAAAACEAISAVSGKEAGIKWVNDIYLDGKKVAGILTEGSFDLESGTMNHIILGVGINAYAPREGFPEDLQKIAGAVFQTACSDGKNRLAAEFLNRFMGYYLSGDMDGYAKSYRDRSIVIGRAIRVFSAQAERDAVALDVDRECRLIVRYADGTVEALSSAEVRIRER